MASKRPKDVLVLYSFATHKTGYYDTLFNRLANKAKEVDLVLSRGSLKDLVFRYQNDALSVVDSLTGRDLASFHAIYFGLWHKAQEQALASSRYLKSKNIPFLSEEISRFAPMTKLGEMARLVEAKLPYPATVTSSAKQLSKIIQQNKLEFEYPVVIKEASAYGGKLNYLAHSPVEMINILKHNRQGVFLIQQFLPNTHDFRVIVLGGRARLVLKRTRPSNAMTHVNNTSAGGEGIVVPISDVDPRLCTLAESASQALGRSSFAGVDILERSDTGEYIVLEVNQTPQIEIGAETDKKMTVMLEGIKEIAGGSDV